MKIFIENPKLYHYPLIWYYLRKKADIYVFDFEQTIKKLKWLRNLMHRGRVYNISNYVEGSGSLALDNIEKAYSFVARSSNLIKSIVRLYDAEDITLSFKKNLTKELSNFFAVQTVLTAEGEKGPEEGKIVFIPYKYLATRQILNRSNLRVDKPEGIIIPSWVKFMNYPERLLLKLGSCTAYFLTSIFSIAVILFKMAIPHLESNIREYQYAIPIIHPGFQFRFKEHRRFDFLLDGVKLTKDNTVFLWLYRYDKNIASAFGLDQYNIVNLSRKNVLLSGKFQLGREGMGMFWKISSSAWRNLLSVFSEYDFNVRCGSSLLGTYLLWGVVLNNLKFANYIAYNDEGINHIGRNILLRRFGCKTWHYAHSGSFGFILADNEKDISRTKHWLWSFLYYDNYIGWNKEMIEYQKLHHQKIGNYHNVGCLWSEFAASGNKDKILDLNSYFMRQGIKKTVIGKDMKIVSFFDTSFVAGVASQFHLRDGIKFYNDIMKLSKEMPDLYIIVKEKKQRIHYENKSSFLYSSDNKQFIAALDLIGSFPNCYVAGFDADPINIIKISDLIITYAFSSSTIEALGARKKAIFYDPMNRFRKNRYEAIPDLVAHGYDELKALVKKLLYEVTDEEYERYLKEEILFKIDDYLDGKAITRFRGLLEKKGEAYVS